MTSPVVDLLLLLVFLAVNPYPRVRMFWDGLSLLLTGLIFGILVITMVFKRIGRVLHPFVSLLKVDMQSKIVSLAIIVSTIAPRAGNILLYREPGLWRLRHAFNLRLGNEMLKFRNGIRRLYVHSYQSQNELPESSPGKGTLLANTKRLHSHIRRRHTIGELIIGVIGSALALVLGLYFNSIFGAVSTLLSVYVIILPLSMFLRGVVVDNLAYSVEMVDLENEEVQRPKKTGILMFQREWNQMLVDNEKFIHKAILVGFIRGEFPFDYRRGEQIWEEVVLGDLTMEEAMDRLVGEQFDDKPIENRYVRRIIRRLFGV